LKMNPIFLLSIISLTVFCNSANALATWDTKKESDGSRNAVINSNDSTTTSATATATTTANLHGNEQSNRNQESRVIRNTGGQSRFVPIVPDDRPGHRGQSSPGIAPDVSLPLTNGSLSANETASSSLPTAGPSVSSPRPENVQKVETHRRAVRQSDADVSQQREGFPAINRTSGPEPFDKSTLESSVTSTSRKPANGHESNRGNRKSREAFGNVNLPGSDKIPGGRPPPPQQSGGNMSTANITSEQEPSSTSPLSTLSTPAAEDGNQGSKGGRIIRQSGAGKNPQPADSNPHIGGFPSDSREDNSTSTSTGGRSKVGQLNAHGPSRVVRQTNGAADKKPVHSNGLPADIGEQGNSLSSNATTTIEPSTEIPTAIHSKTN
jgi:hypothetical protein